MILSAFHGFCMALADSVPGVSGGTIAFILGFYDRFLDALHGLFGKDACARKDAVRYLLKLGLGWLLGMGTCVLVLSQLFAAHIYFMSSLFLGLTLTSFPLVVRAEADALRGKEKDLPFAALGLALVAITAMVLPGISGSTILLIAGVYLPAIQAVRSLFDLDLSVLPGLCALALGFAAGVGLSIRAIRAALKKYRSQTVWLILGLMAGSLYAIAMGPAGLDTPLPPVGVQNFSVPGFLLGVLILLGLDALRRKTAREKSGT